MSLSLQVFLPGSVTGGHRVGALLTDALLKCSSIAKLACRRYLQQTSFFGVTNLEVKASLPIVPLIGIPVGDFRGMHEKIVPNPRVFTRQTGTVRPALRDRRNETGTASMLWRLSDGFRQRF